MILRRLFVIVVALVLAVQVVRNAAVAEFSAVHPTVAAKFWPGHPSVEISSGLAQIGSASRNRLPIDAHVFVLIDDAAVKAPLSPEPFLVRGVQAQISGNSKLAERAFAAAQWRDPRSLPAAYFLAQYYFRTGDALEGLEQTALLARLTPGGGEAVAPFVAVYAQTPANWGKIRALFKSEPGIEEQVLDALSRDARNTEAILAVADADHRKPNSLWLRTLLQSLVSSGDYGRARSIWSSIGRGHTDGQLVFDTTFSTIGPPPPFNWSLTSSTIGLAERQPGKRLHVIFYGNEDGVLASELLTLSRATYRLQVQIVGTPAHPEALRWSIRCDKSRDEVASADLNQVARQGFSFQVPANCPAQWLEFSGLAGDVAQQSDVTITGLRLTTVRVNA